MIIKQGNGVNVTIVCDIPNITLGVVSYSSPSTYVVSINGAAYSSPIGTVYNTGRTGPNGPYYANVTLLPPDTSTLGDLCVMVIDGSSDTIGMLNVQIVAFDPNDATALGLTNLDATVSSRGTSDYAGGAVASVIGSVGGNVDGNVLGSVAGSVSSVSGNVGAVAGDVIGSVGSVASPVEVSGAALTAIADALLDDANGVDTGRTVRQALRLILAALAGKLSIAGPTVTIRDTADAKNRIVATTDITGQRTAVTYDAS